jgi:hypothetical protein
LAVRKSSPSLEEASPPYVLHSLTVCPFSSQIGKPLSSEIVEYEGSRWRLVVYVEADPKKYLSAFLELLFNPDDLRTYQYFVEVVHPDPTRNLSKEHQGIFE